MGLDIIAVCGSEGSGKDTISNIIEKYGYTKVSFACILKDIVSILFGWDRVLLEGSTEESRIWRETVDEWWSKELDIEGFTPRYALQYIATDVFRYHFHNDIWLLSVKRKIMNLGKVIITDARFNNEIEFIKKLGGSLIYVSRNEPEWFQRYKNGVNVSEIEDLHVSQYEWIRNEFDYKIDNNKDLNWLEECVKNILC